jgi:[glutamine synthetase] adenylyltransferase / [glutamine synthetase]-adenylyl-L-tyrosine phosphorylase
MQGEDQGAALGARAAAQCAQWCAAAQGNGLSIPADPGFQEALVRVWEGSEFVARALQQEPALLAELLDSGDLLGDFGSGELDRQLRRVLAGVAEAPADEAQLRRALRRFRRHQMVRIVWRDLAGWAPLEETLEDLSSLADACVARALDLLHAWQVRELGSPEDGEGRPQHLVVLGMGKLGARELNLSSDIDLIFAFPSHGPVRASDGGAARLTSEQFFLRLAQRLVQALGHRTVDGIVFRVDTRLRPFGEAGPLVLSFDAMEDYYQGQAREWERYAMVKARPIAGEPRAVGQLMGILRPFVYRRYLDFAAIESLRRMKGLIAQELERQGLEDDIKLGPGGIREVEFVGQVFQIIRGGREPELQIRPILRVLELLGAKGLLPGYLVHQLAAAYRFLRLVENRLQAWRDQQTHLLPVDPEDRLRLARSMGFADWEGLAQSLGRYRRRVQGHFDKVFAAPQAERDDLEGPYARVWRQTLEPAQAQRLLADAGFADPAETLRRLQLLRDSPAGRGLGSRGRDRLDRLMPMLLEAVAASRAPGRSPEVHLERLLRLIELIAQRTAYLALLVEHPIALSQLVRLTAVSPWIAEQLSRHPLLLDELLDPRRLYAPQRHRDLLAERDTLLAAVDPDDQEQQMERLRQLVQSNMLRVAAADLTGAIPVMIVSDYLTDLAEVTLATVLEQCWRHLARRHGRPQGVLGDDSGFAVIGYGKLGGIELGYGSDLDLVFLHGSHDPNGMTDGERPLANDVLYARLAQRLIHMLSTRTPSGILYEVDTRLRPDGKAGLLVSSLDAFAQYQTHSAWTWEHQALLRARPVAGDPAVRSRFRAIRLEVLSRERDQDRLRADVREMRERMRAQLDRSRGGRFDLKQGHGGIADIEFMVQYYVLHWAPRHPDLLDWTDNIRLLEALDRRALLPGGLAGELADSYRALRSDYHRMALQSEPGLIPEERLQRERRRVREIWQELLGHDQHRACSG